MGMPTRIGRLAALAAAGAVLTGTGYALSSSLSTSAAWAWPALCAASSLGAWRLGRRRRRAADAPSAAAALAPSAGGRPFQSRMSLQGIHLLEAAFDQSGAAMVITDALDRVVMVNPAFVALSGHTAHQLLGQSAELMGMAPLRASHLPGVDTAMREGTRWNGETTLMDQTGQARDLWLAVNVIRDAERRITHHCRVFQDINPLKAQLRALAEQARHDSLTGLPNRRAFGELMFQAMARTRRYPKTLAIMCVDLDGFKAVNDTHGHQVGDELLVQVARRLLACVRNTDSVCRMGGDEFMLILEGSGNPYEVRRIGQRVLTCLTEAYAIMGHHIKVTPSIGAVIHDGRESDTDLVQRADAAMYTAKHMGKCRMVLDETGDEAQCQPTAA